MVHAALDFDAFYEDLEKPLFYSDKGSVRFMWEYTHMGFQDMQKEILESYEHSHAKLLELNKFYKRISTLPTSQIKEMITLFREAIEQDIKMLDAVNAFKSRVTSTKSSYC